MIDYDKIRTRIIIAKAIGKNPDYVRVIDQSGKLKRTLYALDDYKGHNLCLAFDHVPTVHEAREQVKYLYLCGVEWDFDEEMGTI